MPMNRRERRAAAKGTKTARNTPTATTPAALYEIGLQDFRAGRLLEAQISCQKALALDANHADALHLVGLLSLHSNQYDHAVEWISRAIRQQPKTEYLTSLGAALLKQGRREEALATFGKAVQLKPDEADLWRNLGSALADAGRSEDAIRSFQQALKINPNHWDAADKCGSLLLQLRRYDEALASFEESDALRPGRSETLFRKGLCFQALKRTEQAIASYTMALAADAKNFVARNNLGVILLETGQLEEAAAHFLKATQLRPHEGNPFNNLGLTLSRLKRFDEALAALDRAVTLVPDQVEWINNRGNALRQIGRAEEALRDFDRAIVLKPDYAYAHANRAACLDDLSRHDEALMSYKAALALKPDHSDTHWNLAINRLRAGDFKSGWVEAEWRWKVPWLRLNRVRSNAPLWLGTEPIAGKTVLLYNDQGLGDALLFCRYIPLLAERGAKVILEIDGPLKDLMSGLRGIAHCVAKEEALPEHDFHCSLTSLPLAFGTMIDTVPAAVPYLSVREHAKNWESFLGPTGLPRVGIVWSGNPNNTKDHNRSLPLKTLTPLFDLEAQFVSLQKNVRENDLGILCARKEILDAGPELGSFADTAALIQLLDLVISVDTSVAHLAGALGKPLWVLLAYVSDYRWFIDRDDSPWYPSARLFRQDETRDYAKVVARMRSELAAMISARGDTLG